MFGDPMEDIFHPKKKSMFLGVLDYHIDEKLGNRLFKIK